jgi:tRNA (guanine-N7-)-methyltransferase
MARKKHKRIQEATLLPNIFDNSCAGQADFWSKFFGNNNPIILELGCGKGEYVLALAKLWPNFNFVGVDKKGARLWYGAKTALANKINNVAFLRIDISNLSQFFAPHSIEQIWLTFPDPYPKKRQAKKRLTSPLFLNQYKKIIKPKAQLHLKTDNEQLFAYSLKTLTNNGWRTIKKTTDLYQSQLFTKPSLQIQTTYEKRHRQQGKKIFYACWQSPSIKED